MYAAILVTCWSLLCYLLGVKRGRAWEKEETEGRRLDLYHKGLDLRPLLNRESWKPRFKRK